MFTLQGALTRGTVLTITGGRYRISHAGGGAWVDATDLVSMAPPDDAEPHKAAPEPALQQTSAQDQSHPALIYLFGLPGTGKSHVGRLLASRFGFRFADADDWLPDEMLQTLREGRAFTPDQRDGFYELVLQRVAEILQGGCTRLVVAQATFKNQHRRRVREPKAMLTREKPSDDAAPLTGLLPLPEPSSRPLALRALGAW